MKDQRNATIVAGLGFGDEGKGTMVDYFSRKSGVSAVVRFNGGPQARHAVVTPDGRQHVFSQFGSGVLKPGVRTHLSRFMIVDPIDLLAEAQALRQIRCPWALDLLTVDQDALVVTPYHKRMTVAMELLRGNGLHGSCGMGIGEVMRLSLLDSDLVVRVRDLGDICSLRKHIRRIKRFLDTDLARAVSHHGMQDRFKDFTHWSDTATAVQWAQVLHDASRHFRVVGSDYMRDLAGSGSLVFEGAQGVLLDEWYGFHPHTTWSTTTFTNAQTLLREIEFDGSVEKIGVLRAYHTRHGAGPFVTEDSVLTRMLPDIHNDSYGPQGVFRVGWFDMVLARYALEVCGGADALAITNLDRFRAMPDRKIGTAYRTPGGDLIDCLPIKSELTDLTHQEALTRLLHQVAPQYVAAPTPDEDYIQMIEQYLGVPVAITSHGPTAADKRMRLPVVLAA